MRHWQNSALLGPGVPLSRFGSDKQDSGGVDGWTGSLLAAPIKTLIEEN